MTMDAYSALAQCEGKKRFDTYSLAAKILKRKNDKRAPRMVYRCPFCHGFHLGAAHDRDNRLRGTI